MQRNATGSMVHWLTIFFVLAAVHYMLCQSGSEPGAPFTVSYLYWVHVAMLLCNHTAHHEVVMSVMLRMGSAITWWQWPHLCNVIGTKFCFDARHVWTATLCIKQNLKQFTLQRFGQCHHGFEYPLSQRLWLQCSMKALMQHTVAALHKGCNCSVLWRLCCKIIAR